MKKTFITLTTALILAFFILSCNKEKEAYYRFSQFDYKRLLPYTEEQVLKFKNKSNDERHFTIRSVNTAIKTRYSVGMGFMGDSAGDYFYYDSKEITFIYSEDWQPSSIFFCRFPVDVQLAKENREMEYPSEFYGSINWRFWNGCNEYGSYDSYVSIDYKQKKTEMTFNGKIYKNVFVLDSGINTIIENSDVYVPNKDVNIIYYDEIEGIIGFDDLNGNEWRLVN